MNLAWNEAGRSRAHGELGGAVGPRVGASGDGPVKLRAPRPPVLDRSIRGASLRYRSLDNNQPHPVELPHGPSQSQVTVGAQVPDGTICCNHILCHLPRHVRVHQHGLGQQPRRAAGLRRRAERA